MGKNFKKYFKLNEANESYPANVVQVVQHLLYNLPFRDKMEVAIKTESELPKLNWTLGEYNQNEFALSANMSLIESCTKLRDHDLGD